LSATPAMEVFLALGTNLGDRLKNLIQAIQNLNEFVQIEAKSSIYETPPWGVLDQPNFLNQIIQGITHKTPKDLLKSVKKIELSMGRVPSTRFGPRLIDIDILIYDDEIVETPDLVIPHPRLLERAFVLVPLAEIAPNLVIPGSEITASKALSLVGSSGITKFPVKL
jgi:2-amino-4-hydroxy-6-hydroxymethyldihydropteridine diphosphokinase